MMVHTCCPITTHAHRDEPDRPNQRPSTAGGTTTANRRDVSEADGLEMLRIAFRSLHAASQDSRPEVGVLFTLGEVEPEGYPSGGVENRLTDLESEQSCTTCTTLYVMYNMYSIVRHVQHVQYSI